MKDKSKGIGAAIIAVVLLFGVPHVIQDPYFMHILIISMINIALALSLNFLILTGHVSLAHGAFLGIGAYTSTLTVMRLGGSFWFALPMAALISALISLPLGLLTLKMKGVHFALATFAFNEILRMIFVGWVALFGGPTGIPGIPPPEPIVLSNFATWRFETKSEYFYVVCCFVLIIAFVIIRLQRSRTGMLLRAIAQGELLTECLGIHAMKFKVFAFVLSSTIAGAAGSIYAHYIHFICPGDFSFWESVNVLVFAVMGGIGTIWGPIIGSVAMTIIPELFRFAAQYQLLLDGLVLILVLLFVPDGMYGLFKAVARLILFKMKGNVFDTPEDGRGL